MKSYVIVSIIALSQLTGCSDVLGNHYNIVISPGFTPEQVSSIKDAVQSWKDALGDNIDIMSISEEQCNGALIPTLGSLPPGNVQPPNLGPRRQICIHAVNGSWLRAEAGGSPLGSTDRHPAEDSADIFIPVDKDSSMTQSIFMEVIAHELGHAFGLEHTQENTLMYWAIAYITGTGPNLQTLKPTCSDVSQWLSIRSMDEYTQGTICTNGVVPWHYYH